MNRFNLKALVEKLSFNVRHIFDNGEKKEGKVILEVFDKRAPSFL